MLDYQALFARVVDRLESVGLHAELSCGPPLEDALVTNIQRELSIGAPLELIELYRQVGNGISFRWRSGKPIPPSPEFLQKMQELKQLGFERLAHLLVTERYEEGAASNMYFPSFEALVERYMSDARTCGDGNAFGGLKHVSDMPLARQTAQQMRKWFGFREEGNGDRLCIDTGRKPSPVVYDQHDWYDGGTGANGRYVAESFSSFMQSWAGVCFQHPTWWPLADSGVDWQSSDFDPRFRLD